MDWRRLGPKKVRRYINPDMQIKSQVQGLTLSSFFREYMFFIRHCSVLSVTFVSLFSSDKLRKMRFAIKTYCSNLGPQNNYIYWSNLYFLRRNETYFHVNYATNQNQICGFHEIKISKKLVGASCAKFIIA